MVCLHLFYIQWKPRIGNRCHIWGVSWRCPRLLVGVHQLESLCWHRLGFSALCNNVVDEQDYVITLWWDMRCNKVLHFDIITIWDYMCVWTSWAHIYEYLVLLCKIGCDKKMIQRLNVKGVPIQIQDFIFTNQRNEQRKRGCYGCGELGHFVEVCPNKPTPKTKKKTCKDKTLTSIKSWDDSSSEKKDHHKEVRAQALIIKLFSCVPYGTR